MTTSSPRCGARPVEGIARCDQDPAICRARGWHSAPLYIGGRLKFTLDHRHSFEMRDDPIKEQQ